MAAELASENIYHILSRLPVKSLARFQCVSKRWCSYINNPYLETLHAKRAVINDPILISFHNLSSKTKPDPKYSTIQKDQFIIRFLEYKDQAPVAAGICTLELRKKPPVIELMCKKEDYYGYFILGSCNGLLYSARMINGDTNLVVFNPLTKECCELPPIPRQQPPWEIGYVMSNLEKTGLGFDYSTNTFKMVFIVPIRVQVNVRSFKEDLCTMVHVLGTDSWQTIPQVPSDFITGEGVFVHGSLHWLSKDYRKTKLGKSVISFDMAKEEFGLINTPDHVYSGLIIKQQLVDLHGELGCVYQIGNHMVEVWVLKETGWAMHCMFEKKPPLSHGRMHTIKVLGFWNERKDVLMTIDGWQMFVYNLNNDRLYKISSVGLKEEGSDCIDIRMYQSSLFSTRYSLF